MGCKCNRITPVVEPVVIPEPDKTRRPSIRVERRNSEGELDQLIDSLINKSRTTSADETLVHIDDANPEAFDRHFLEQRQRTIDNPSVRATIQAWRCSSLDQLVETIRAFSRNKSAIDCHWIIFYWIACNIEYDTVSYFTKNYADQTAQGVFRSKKGVCAGYANIYKHICDNLDIPCEVVGGYSKGYGFDGYANAPSETDHAWNAVRIGEYWYLIESTWGAGSLDERKAFKRELESYYFLPRPKEMIYHHLPENPRWQLLQQTVPMDQFWRMPKIYPAYFDLNLELIYPRHQSIIELAPNKPYALVLVKTPSDVSLLADLKLNDQKIDGGHRVILDRRRKMYCCYFAPNTIGRYEIKIFGRRGTIGTGTYSSVINLLLDVPTVPRNSISYPETWTLFDDLNLKVLSPKYTHIIRLQNGATNAQICIQTPADVELLGRLQDDREEAIDGGEQVYFDREKGYWQCNFAPSHDGMFKALIMAKRKSDSGSYTSAISFRIEARNIPRPPLSYPKTWKLFYDLNLKVLTPKDTHIIRLDKGNANVEICIQTPADVELLGRLQDDREEAIDGGEQVYLDREKDYWQCNFAPNHDGMFKALIMAKRKSDSGSYTSAILFTIEARNIPRAPLSYPHTWQSFYDLGLRIDAPRDRANAVWPDNASFAEVRLTAPDDVRLSGAIEYDQTRIENGTLTQYDHEKRQWQLLFAPQRTGEHKLWIFAQRQSDKQSSQSAVAQLGLNVTKLRTPMTFPVTYQKFDTNKCRIREPLNGVLKRGAIVPLHCVIPGATAVQLQVDSKWIDQKGYVDPVLKMDVHVGSTDVNIYAKYGEGSSYDGLIKYSVQ